MRRGTTNKRGRSPRSRAHLGSGVLHAHAVRAELEVALAALDVLVLGVVKMRVDDLLRQGQRAVESVRVRISPTGISCERCA